MTSPLRTTAKNNKLEALVISLDYFSKVLKDENTFIPNKTYNKLHKTIKSIRSGAKYNQDTYKDIVKYSKVIDDVISGKKFSGEMFFWLLLNWYKDEHEDLIVRSRFAHLDMMFYITKMEVRYPKDSKEHHEMLNEILKRLGL
jgi:hypothetical protein